jgi:hypothetical protein
MRFVIFSFKSCVKNQNNNKTKFVWNFDDVVVTGGRANGRDNVAGGRPRRQCGRRPRDILCRFVIEINI